MPSKEQLHQRRLMNTIRKKYYEKHDKKCGKCGSRQKVELHHKISFHDKNTLNLEADVNREENLFPLCNKCHKQYHRYYDSTNIDDKLKNFNDFLNSPTLSEAQAFYKTMVEYEGELTRKELLESFDMVKKAMRDFRGSEEYEG